MTQLHLHSHYSILDGVGQAKHYADKAILNNHKSIAITDHGNINGILEFQKELLKKDIRPLIGCELYTTDYLIETDENNKRKRTKTNHLIVLAKDKIGYQNLLKLNWLSMQDDHYYYSSKILLEEVMDNKEGLMIGTACMASKFGRLIEANKQEEAEILFKLFIEQFKDNFYGEIQFNEIPQQKIYNSFIIEMCKKNGIPICITGDVHYANPEDNELQTLSIMINRKQTIEDRKKEDFWDIDAKNLFYHNEQDYLNFNKKWSYGYEDSFIKHCLDNTDYIANKVLFVIPKREKFYIPHFDSKEKLLKEKLIKGIKEKFPKGLTKEYQDRLSREYEIIKEAGLIDYFLIVADFHDYAINTLKSFCGIGRGSFGSSLLGYLLNIHSLDPIKNNLIFERFITRERAKGGYPDIDSDFAPEVKEKIQDYLIQKYGKEQVLHVATYTTLGIKSSVKDLLRINCADYIKSNELTKELDDDKTLNENIELIKETKPELYKFYLKYEKEVNIAPRLEGMIRQAGQHAGGLVITSDKFNTIAPVNRVSGNVITAFQESGSHMDLDSLGIIKFDILGLNTLGIIDNTIENIYKYRKDVDGMNREQFRSFLKNLPLDDKGIYEEINYQNKYKLFQISGKAFIQLSDKLLPSNFEEMNALNAMARPGTKDFFPDYLEGKKGVMKYHPEIHKHLKHTFGTILFQEDTMNLFNKIGGFSLEETDKVRGLMKKLSKKDKDPEVLKKWEEAIGKFSIGAEKLGIPKEDIEKLADDLIKFSDYSFNNSHSTAYSLIGAITAYLAHYYRPEFYCACLNNEKDSDGIMEGISACKFFNIKVLPPDINRSEKNFTTTENGEIIFGLNGIKFVGEKAIDLIIENRPFSSFDNFLELKARNITKRTIQSLVCVGCFDSFDDNRKKLLHTYMCSRDKKLSLDNTIITTEEDLQEYERLYLGYIVFSSKFRKEIFERLKNFNYYQRIDEIDKAKYTLVLLEKIRILTDKNNNEMAFLKLKDQNDKSISVPIFSGDWKILKDNLKENTLYLVILRKQEENKYLFGLPGFKIAPEIIKKSIIPI